MFLEEAVADPQGTGAASERKARVISIDSSRRFTESDRRSEEAIRDWERKLECPPEDDEPEEDE